MLVVAKISGLIRSDGSRYLVLFANALSSFSNLPFRFLSRDASWIKENYNTRWVYRVRVYLLSKCDTILYRPEGEWEICNEDNLESQLSDKGKHCFVRNNPNSSSKQVGFSLPNRREFRWQEINYFPRKGNSEENLRTAKIRVLLEITKTLVEKQINYRCWSDACSFTK